MIYLKTLDTIRDEITENLFYCWGDVHRALFSPDVEQLAIIEFKTHGKTYAERRENLRQMAQDFQSNESGHGLYSSDLLEIEDFFRVNGARLGLMREFHENGIL